MNQSYLLWHRLIVFLYFRQAILIHGEQLPKGGSTLFVAHHRNGAVDGFVLHRFFPAAIFLISVQLRKSLLGRLFFTGIEVARVKDGSDQGRNAQAMIQCRDVLAKGGQLLIFPEGTSSLGHRHLPFKSGAAALWMEAIDAGIPVSLVPIALHYDCAWGFQRRVEVVVGQPVAPPSADLNQRDRLRLFKRAMTAGLESVGVEADSQEEWKVLQTWARLAMWRSDRSFARSLKRLSLLPLEKKTSLRQEFDALCLNCSPLLDQQVWRMPTQGTAKEFLILGLLAPVTWIAALLNAPPLLAAGLVARLKADDMNVVALWRVMVGLPAFVLWLGLSLFVWGHWVGVNGCALYLAFTFGGRTAWSTVRESAYALYNGFRFPSRQKEWAHFRQSLWRVLDDN